MRSLTLYLLFMGLGVLLLAQSTSPSTAQNSHKISGLVNNDSGQPLEYATITVLAVQDSSIVSGTVTNAKGTFTLEVPEGKYWVRMAFMGYKPWYSELLQLTGKKSRIQLPEVVMVPQATTLDEVEISAEKSRVELALDKKIFHVGKDLSSAGATASEILQNIPSVTVDPEGNVKLRGSSEVRILIDGKPSGLVSFKGGQGLQQLQGSLIESVEVITNPSARYEAEGMAGIINIVLKKNRKKGFNGSFELITGNPANHGVSANVNYRYKKINFFINYGLSYRIQPNIGSLYQEVYNPDTTLIQRQESGGQREGWNNNIRGGLDYFFNERNIFTASYRFQRMDGKRVNNFRYEDYLFRGDNLIGTSLRDQYEEEQEPYSEYVLTYKKLFSKKGHELTIDARYLNYWENSDQTFTEVTFTPQESQATGTTMVQRSINDEFEDQYLVQLDYIQPIGNEGKLEAGIRSSFRDMENDFLATEKNAQGEFVTIPQFDNIFLYKENIQAVYGILGNKSSGFSYQAGLRVEATDVNTVLEETNEENPRKYTNLFPSAHATFHLPGQNDLQVSYSRRIRRPVYRDLSPFVTLANGRNFFSGNPDLDPEYTDAFEIGHLKYFDKGSLSSAIYYRYSQATIQRIRLVDEIGFATTLPQNLKDQHSFGAEWALGYQLKPWWKLDANFNFYRAITDGTNLDDTFSSDTYSWFIRQTSRFTLPKSLVVQLTANYQAPEQIPQGRQKSIAGLDVAIRKNIWQDKGTLTLSAIDVFNSRKQRTVTEGLTFFTDRLSQRQRRQINLTLSYRLNQGN